MVTEVSLGPRFLTRFNWPREIADGRGFAEITDGVLRGAMMDSRIEMLVIHRAKKEFFADTVKSFLAAQPDTLAIAGCFADNGTMSAAPGMSLGSGTLAPDLQGHMGFTVEGGRRIGEARPGRAFLIVDNNRKIRIGRGDTPPDTLHGFSGLGAMILGGKKFPTNDPADAGRDEFYRGQSSRGAFNGNTVVAIAEKEGFVLAMVKPHGSAFKIDDLRDRLAESGFSDAVFLDGSDSVFWNLRGAVPPGLAQGEDKNRITTFGLAFLRSRPNR